MYFFSSTALCQFTWGKKDISLRIPAKFSDKIKAHKEDIQRTNLESFIIAGAALCQELTVLCMYITFNCIMVKNITLSKSSKSKHAHRVIRPK